MIRTVDFDKNVLPGVVWHAESRGDILKSKKVQNKAGMATAEFEKQHAWQKEKLSGLRKTMEALKKELTVRTNELGDRKQGQRKKR